MKIMKLLHVTGGDYSATEFQRTYKGTLIEDFVNAYELELEKPLIIEIEDNYFEVTLLEFYEVDPKFIEFVKHNLMDYDDSKHNNFFIDKI